MESGGPSSGSIGSLDHKKPASMQSSLLTAGLHLAGPLRLASMGRGMLVKKASTNNSRFWRSY